MRDLATLARSLARFALSIALLLLLSACELGPAPAPADAGPCSCSLALCRADGTCWCPRPDAAPERCVP